MHVKIQGGGGGKYSNSGSCSSVVSYLEHEDLERLEKNKSVENFFSHDKDSVDANFIIDSIDNNRKKLCKEDAKFFVITVSLSDKENKHLLKYDGGISEQLKSFVRKEVMEKYAANFNKGIKGEDLMYFAKIHHDRKSDSKNELNAHCHIVVSRKTLDGKMKISPMTNHINTKSGAIKGGFSRVNFYDQVEKAYDNKFIYARQFQESFEFNKGMKKGSSKEIKLLMEKQFFTNEDKKKQLDYIDKLCTNLNFDDNLKADLMKGYQYEISGTFRFGDSKHELQMNNEKVFIELKDDKFELMVGLESFKDWLMKSNSLKHMEEDFNHNKKRRMRR